MCKQMILGLALIASLLVGTARADEALNRALFIAVDNGDLHEVQSLISRGADASATRGEITGDLDLKQGGIQPVFMTPFSYAVSRTHPNQEICRLLGRKVRFAIPWTHADDGTKKETVYSLRAPVANDNIEITEILLQRGASIAEADEGTVLLSVVKSTGMAELLLSHGANVNAKSAAGESALHTLTNMGATVAEWLVAHGAEIDIKDNTGRTPLHVAALRLDPENVEFLLKHGADVNAKDNDGATPLHMLGSKDFWHWRNDGHKETQLVELLLSHGADVNAKDKDGQTPLGRVTATADQELTQALQAHGGTTNIGPRELLQQSLSQFKDHSDNETLRTAIINLALKEHPPVPSDAEAAAGRGAYIFKNAKAQDDTLNAAKEYLSAIESAPWVANYYYNLCTVLEKTPYTQQALHACKLYLVAVPNAPDAGDMKQRIAGLQYAADRGKAQMKQRTAYIKTTGREELYRYGGISGTVSGKDIALKLVVDWYAAPPKYQIFVACIESDGAYGHPHDLVTTDSWSDMCKSDINMHLVIKPEGEGFVEVSDASGNRVRATLDELFAAKQKTLAQSIMYSGDGNRFYVTYVQGGVNDGKHLGWAMWDTDCNGNLLRQDPRALPNDFSPGKIDFERFNSEEETDLCKRQFTRMTGYHFGETE